MVFYVIVVTFLKILPMNKFTSTITDDWKLDEIHFNYQNNIYYTMYPNIYVMKHCHEWLNIEWKKHLISGSTCNDNSIVSNFLARNDK